MNESPEQQRQRVEREAALKTELWELCRKAGELKLVSVCGESDKPEKPWWIQHNGKDEYFTLEEAKSKLEEILESGIA